MLLSILCNMEVQEQLLVELHSKQENEDMKSRFMFLEGDIIGREWRGLRSSETDFLRIHISFYRE